MQLRGIASDEPEIVIALALDGEGLREGFADDFGDLLNELFRLKRTALAVDSAREGEHLPHDAGRAFGAGLDGADKLFTRRRRPLLVEEFRGKQDRAEHVVQVVRHAAGQRADAFEPLRAEEVLLRLLAPRHFIEQFPRALHDDALRLLQAVAGLLREFPLLTERAGELEHLDARERFFQNQQPVAAAASHDHFLPRIIRIRRADDHLQLRRNLPEPLRRLDAIHAGRHPHIDKGERGLAALRHRALQQRAAFRALEGKFQRKSALGHPRDFLAEK